MRSTYLVFLASVLGVSAGPTIMKADAYGQCAGTRGIETAKCPSGFRCDPVNPSMYTSTGHPVKHLYSSWETIKKYVRNINQWDGMK